jgi:hypothetical protein
LQYSSVAKDDMGGRAEPTWTDFGIWWAKVLTVPFVQSDTTAALMYQAEGPYREDLWNYFAGGTGVRLLAKGLTLKVSLIENPQLRNRTLLVHCAPAVNTQ